MSQKFGRKYLTTALAVYPHEEPGIGPNKYNFDDDVLYALHFDLDGDGKPEDTTIEFRFSTEIRPPFDGLPVAYAGVDTSGGKSLGPRLLLPLLPLLSVSAVTIVASYLRSAFAIDRLVSRVGALRRRARVLAVDEPEKVLRLSTGDTVTYEAPVGKFDVKIVTVRASST